MKIKLFHTKRTKKNPLIKKSHNKNHSSQPKIKGSRQQITRPTSDEIRDLNDTFLHKKCVVLKEQDNEHSYF